MKVVFIGAESTIVEPVASSSRLQQPDATVLVSATATNGIELVGQESPDVVIMYPDFPDMTLAQAVQELRRNSDVPLIVLGRVEERTQLIAALLAGADDFVCLPCPRTELMARMRARLRRSSPGIASQPGAAYGAGELLISPASYEVFLGDQELELTHREFQLLHRLASNRGAVVTHERLQEALGVESLQGNELVKKYVQRVRRKLGDDARHPRWIANVPRIGYRFLDSP